MESERDYGIPYKKYDRLKGFIGIGAYLFIVYIWSVFLDLWSTLPGPDWLKTFLLYFGILCISYFFWLKKQRKKNRED